MSDRSAKFIHAFEHGKRGGMTIGYRGAWLETQYEVKAGVSFCSTRDQYSRKRGAIIAAGRLETHPVSFVLAEEPTTQEIHAHVMALVIQDRVHGTPDRLIKR